MLRMETTGTHVKKYSLNNLFLPLATVGMMGSAITFLSSICNGNTRWVILLCLFLFLLLRRNFLRAFDAPFAFFLFLYLGWCFFTSFWSDVPILSFMKSCIFFVVVITLVRAGTEWVRIHAWQNALDYLWILAFIALLAGFLGKYTAKPDSVYLSASTTVIQYQGLVHGSNMFGSLLAMSFPFLLWKTYSRWSNKRDRIIWFLLISSCIFFLIQSISRSAVLAVILTFLVFIISMNLERKISLFLISIMIISALLTIYPSILTNISSTTTKYIHKTSQVDLFKSRREVWQNSYVSALEGGSFGLGYGVSFGQSNFTLDYGLNSGLYGREKGNSQLAIMEETGVVGLILYSVLIIFIFSKLFRLYIKAHNSNHRVLIGIIFGIFLGMLAQSVFEAWWDSPGSQESIYFWILVGIIRGLEITTSNQRATNAAPNIET